MCYNVFLLDFGYIVYFVDWWWYDVFLNFGKKIEKKCKRINKVFLKYVIELGGSVICILYLNIFVINIELFNVR